MAKRKLDIELRARDRTGKAFGKVKRNIAGLRKSFGGLNAVMAGAAAFFISGKIIQAFAEQERAERGLADALRIVNKSADFRSLKRYASELQALTTEGDETILGMLQLGTTLGKLSGQQLKDAVKSAIGLSRALKIDLNTSMRLVARAAVGDTTTLTRYGIKLDSTMSAQEKFNKLLEIGAENFLIAAGEADTFGGRLKQIMNSLGDLAEKTGDLIVESMRRGDESAKDTLKRIREAIDETGELMALHIEATRERKKQRREVDREREKEGRPARIRDDTILNQLAYLISGFTGLVNPRDQGPFLADLERELDSLLRLPFSRKDIQPAMDARLRNQNERAEEASRNMIDARKNQMDQEIRNLELAVRVTDELLVGNRLENLVEFASEFKEGARSFMEGVRGFDAAGSLIGLLGLDKWDRKSRGMTIPEDELRWLHLRLQETAPPPPPPPPIQESGLGVAAPSLTEGRFLTGATFAAKEKRDLAAQRAMSQIQKDLKRAADALENVGPAEVGILSSSGM